MTDMQDKNESSVGLIEKQANELIAEEVQEQETEKEEQSLAPDSQDHVVEASDPKAGRFSREQPQNEASARPGQE